MAAGEETLGGDGEGRLDGMVRTCTPRSVVTVDASFTAGVQAGLVARRVAAIRSGS